MFIINNNWRFRETIIRLRWIIEIVIVCTYESCGNVTKCEQIRYILNSNLIRRNDRNYKNWTLKINSCSF